MTSANPLLSHPLPSLLVLAVAFLGSLSLGIRRLRVYRQCRRAPLIPVSPDEISQNAAAPPSKRRSRWPGRRWPSPTAMDPRLAELYKLEADYHHRLARTFAQVLLILGSALLSITLIQLPEAINASRQHLNDSDQLIGIAENFRSIFGMYMQQSFWIIVGPWLAIIAGAIIDLEIAAGYRALSDAYSQVAAGGSRIGSEALQPVPSPQKLPPTEERRMGFLTLVLIHVGLRALMRIVRAGK